MFECPVHMTMHCHKNCEPLLAYISYTNSSLFAFFLTSFDGKMKNNARFSTNRRVISRNVFIKQGKTPKQSNRDM